MSKRIGYMFAGQGAQTPGMGRDLYEQSPAARAAFTAADAILGRSVSELCFVGSAAELTACANCQPAITAMSLACLAAWVERTGVTPAICGGLSLGEYSALHAAGVLTAADALRLVAERGRLMDHACRQSDGGMAAIIGGDPELVAHVCAGFDIDIANYNCPGQIVISGAREGLRQAMQKLAEAELRVVELPVAGAYHSRLMQPAADAFRPLLQACPLSPPACLVAQNATGQCETEPETIRVNLARQVSGSVRWEQCARVMLAECDALLEFGPGQVLTGFIRRLDRQFPCAAVNSMPGLENAVQLLN
ncbi:MAG: ACP S-malonyltransferase [Lentisphaeria bacterium]|nr:ACP S-malonyltransferase [Lentisphaeria bacterium]